MFLRPRVCGADAIFRTVDRLRLIDHIAPGIRLVMEMDI